MNNIIGKQGGNYSQKKTFSIDNEIIDNSEKIANAFNNFFVSIGHNLAKNITCNINPLIYVNSVNDSIVVITRWFVRWFGSWSRCVCVCDRIS